MEIAKIEIDKTTGVCTSRRRIPAGIVGATVSVVFKDPVWDNLTKTVVFRGKDSRIAEFDGTVAVIPGDILAKPGVGLHFGIWGHNPQTGMQIPLIEIPIGITEKATDPQADPGVDPGLPIWAQLQQDIEELKNAGVGKPGEKGDQGDPGEDGGWYTPAVTQPDKNTIEFAFTPSKDGMSAVAPVSVELPDSDGNVEDHNTDPASHADIRKRLAAANIVESASGDLITVSDASDMELAGLKVFGKTTQDGTPSPDAPVPLESVGKDGSIGVTVAGKNLLTNTIFDSGGSADSGLTLTFNDDGSIHVVGTANGNYNVGLMLSNPIPKGTKMYAYVEGYKGCRFISRTSKGTNVYSNGLTSSGGGYLTVDDVNNNVTDYFEAYALTIRVAKDTTVDVNVKLMVSKTETTYEAPKESQTLAISTPNGLPGIPVTSGGNYTDEKGQQWVCDEVDFEKGVYVQRMKKVVLDGSDDEDWQAGQSSAQADKYRKRIILDDKLIFTKDQIEPMLCDRYPITKNGTTGDAYNCITSFAGTTNQSRVYFYDEAMPGSNEAEWRAYLSEHPIALMYVLATPAETALSEEELTAYAALHTNYPNTTVFNDGGAGMEVKYVADTKLYVDKKFAELAQAMLNQ